MQAISAITVPREQIKKGEKRQRSAAPEYGAEVMARPEVAAPPKGERSDRQLLEAFQAGEERAFAELYTRYKAEIYTFCLRMLGGDSAEAGDAFQETFIKVYEKCSTFTYGENVRGWLYMIARNVALNVYRSRKPEETIENHQGLASTERSLSPDFLGEQRTLREALEAALAQLPHEFREPFILREFDGLAYPEIAEITGVTMSLVKIRIHRAKQRLRKTLAPLFADEINASHNITYNGTLEEESDL